MISSLRLLYQDKGWHVFALPVVMVLAAMVLVDTLWPRYAENQDRIESLESRLARAESLAAQEPQFRARIDAAESALTEARAHYFVSATVADSRAEFLSAVTSVVAALNLPSVSIVPESVSADVGEVISMQIAVTFDASPAQFARLEAQLMSFPKTIHVETVSIAGGVVSTPGTGVLRVTCQLRSVHINSTLF